MSETSICPESHQSARRVTPGAKPRAAKSSLTSTTMTFQPQADSLNKYVASYLVPAVKLLASALCDSLTGLPGGSTPARRSTRSVRHSPTGATGGSGTNFRKSISVRTPDSRRNPPAGGRS